jgi:hypothetical protein
MNRYTLILLSIYILILACLSCQDDCCKYTQEIVHSPIEANIYTSDLPIKNTTPIHKDCCTHLCFSYTSIIVSSIPSFKFPTVSFALANVFKSVYNVLEVSTYIFAVFQPPQSV